MELGELLTFQPPGGTHTSGSPTPVQGSNSISSYDVWRSNAPYLYDVLLSQPLEWPSLAVEWLPNFHGSTQRIAIGTETSGQETDMLIIAEIRFPPAQSVIDAYQYQSTEGYRPPTDGTSVSTPQWQVKAQMMHSGGVNRIACMPQNPFVLATASSDRNLYIFEYSKHPSFPPAESQPSPQITLARHKAEGYGLSWNNHKEGLLLSAAYDGRACLWDLGHVISQKESEATPLAEFTPVDPTQSIEVTDIAWHLGHGSVFGTVASDNNLKIWDIRSKSVVASTAVGAYSASTLDFHPFSSFTLLTGDEAGTVSVWDTRKLRKLRHGGVSQCSSALSQLKFHTGAVYRVKWSVWCSAVFASCGADQQVAMWSLGRARDSRGFTESQGSSGPPEEVMFVHSGHTAEVSDIAWGATEETRWTIASVAGDNILHAWQPAEMGLEEALC